MKEWQEKCESRHEKAGLLLISSSWPKKELSAIKPDGEGDVAATKIVWKNLPGAPYVSSPASAGDFFFTIAESGHEIYCFAAASGKVAWHAPFGRCHASPVIVGDRIYFTNDKGLVRIVQVGEKYQVVAENEMEEQCYASPAISGGQIFLRGAKYLYCIGQAR